MLELLIVVLITLAEVLAPVIVGLLTVPLTDQLKRLLDWIKARPPWVVQLFVPIIALGLTYLSKLIGVALPADLWLWAEPEIAAVLSAAIAYAIYAAKKLVGLERALRMRGYMV